MDIKDAVRSVMQEWMMPEFKSIRDDIAGIKATLDLTNKRLDDVNLHLADQSRRIDETNKRIDEIRADLTARIDGTRADLTTRIDETNKRIDEIRADLTARIDETRADLTTRIDETRADLTARIDETRFDLIKRIDETRAELKLEIMKNTERIDSNNHRLDELTAAIVRREEHDGLKERIHQMELDISLIKQRVAA